MVSCVPINHEAFELLRQGSLALAEVQNNGIRIDVDALNKSKLEVTNRISELEVKLHKGKVYRKWKSRYGEKFTLGNSLQLATVLFEDFGYDCKYKSGSSGRYSSDEAALKSTKHPYVDHYLAWKKMNKVLGTYLTGIEREVTPEGYLHPFFNLETTDTFRSSSSDINFQNIPIRDPYMGKLIRDCIIPSEGHQIIELDYAGVEVRVAYCYHKDPTMYRYLTDPTTDMHRDMAVQCFMLNAKKIPKEWWSDKFGGKPIRHCGKNMFVFPSFYGSSWGNIAQNLWDAISELNLVTPSGLPMGEYLSRKGITELGKLCGKDDPDEGTFALHIKNINRHFWKTRFRVYDKWKRDWYDQYQQNGGMTSYSGFHWSGNLTRNQVINYPIQSAAFHCLLRSLIKIQQYIKKHKMKSRLIGQIHDSIVGDVHRKERDDFIHIAHRIATKELMEAWKWLILPMEVEVEVAPVGASWFHKEKWELK